MPMPSINELRIQETTALQDLKLKGFHVAVSIAHPFEQFYFVVNALLGYNIGESKVQEGINKLGSRDAWYLTRNGYQGDKYLARLMAVILIMKNPDSVN